MKIPDPVHRLILIVSVGALAVFSVVFVGPPTAYAQMGEGTSPAPSPALNDDARPPTSRSQTSELARGDRRFFEKITRLGEAEVALSTVASRRATDARVRGLAVEMVREHTRTNAEIAALARRKGAVLEPRDATDRRAEDKKWNEKEADDFSEDYLDALIDSRQDMIDVLENAVDSKDAEIAEIAKRLLPQFKGLLERAEAFEDAMD